MNRLKPLQSKIKTLVEEVLENLPERTRLRYDELVKSEREIVLYLFLMIAICAIPKNIVELIENSILNNIASVFESKFLNDLLFGGIVTYSFYRIIIIKIVAKDLVPSFISIARSLILTCVYFVAIKPEISQLEDYSFTFTPYFHYLDALIFSVSLLTLRCKPYKKLQIDTPEYSLIEDYFDLQKDVDELSREPYAKTIGNHIKNTINQKAFAIAIIGDWGSGKTTFMDFVKKNLKNDEEKNIIIDYNPWKVTDAKIMIDDFFDSFISAIENIDADLSKQLRSYSDYLTNLDDGMIQKIVSLTTNIFHKSGSTSAVIDSYEQINEQIRILGKRFIVFVDDLDRLTGSEILQVVKIIRNTANFNNVFFVVGIDYNYVVESVRKTRAISNEDTYLQKIFQLEIILPPFDTSKVLKSVKKNIFYERLQPDEKINFDVVFDRISNIHPRDNFPVSGIRLREGLLEKHLNNFRDIVRFSNSFNISYRILRDHVDLLDLVLLEIVKIKFPTVYMKLGSREILKYSNVSEGKRGYTIDKEKVKKLLVKQRATENLEDLLALLYEQVDSDTKGLDELQSIIHPRNHFTYYNFFLFADSTISIRDFEKFRNSDLEDMINQVSIWSANPNQQAVLNEILNGFNVYKDADEFKKFVLIKLLLAGQNYSWIRHVHTILKDDETLSREYELDSQSKIEYFIRDILKESRVPLITRANLATNFLRDILYNRDKPYFTQKELTAILLEYLTQHLQHQTDLSYTTMDIYYANMQSIDPFTKRITLSDDASEKMRSFIINHSTNYLKILLRPAYHPYKDEYTFDPFLWQIFKDKGGDKINGYENFRQFLSQYKADLKLKKFIQEKFEEFYSLNVNHNFTRDNWIKLTQSEIQYLNQIQADLTL